MLSDCETMLTITVDNPSSRRQCNTEAYEGRDAKDSDFSTTQKVQSISQLFEPWKQMVFERYKNVLDECVCSNTSTADSQRCDDTQKGSGNISQLAIAKQNIKQKPYNCIPSPYQKYDIPSTEPLDSYQSMSAYLRQLFQQQDSCMQRQKQMNSSLQAFEPVQIMADNNGDSDNSSFDSENSNKQQSVKYDIPLEARKFSQCEFDADIDAANQNAKIFESFNSDFQRSDYSYLYKRQEMLDKYIRKLTSNWEFNKVIYESHIKRLMDLIKAKIEFVSESKIIYERIYLLVDYLEELLDYRGSRRQAKSEQNVVDFLYQHFVQELQQRSARNGVYYIRNSVNSDTRISLNEHISKHPEFSEQPWREILFLTANHINERYHKELPKPFILEQKKQCNVYDCIGCARFFNINENVYYPEKLKGLLALGGSCMRIEANRASVLEEICGLLNGGGGVLMFNTQLYYNNVFARGQYVTEIQKEEIEQRLNTLLNFIYPKPKPANIILTWVPMVDPTQPSDERNPLSFIDGLYVARVMIKPTEGHIAYFWIQEGAPIFSIREKSIEPNGKRIIKGRDIQKFIKQKFKKFEAECLEQGDSFDKELIKSQLPIVHKCCQPHLGRQISQPKAQIEKEESNEHEKFTYASIVVAKKSDHETIRANLKKYNIDCVIRTPFEKLKLRGASNSSVLYHNTRFDELLGVVSYNNDFKFGNRYLLVILITPYIRLIERNKDNQMNENDLKSLGVWLNREYPKETLSLWQFINENDQLEYYISTGTRESSLYIYIVMTQFQEKSSFKNPKGLERLSQQEREKRFKKIYTTGSA